MNRLVGTKHRMGLRVHVKLTTLTSEGLHVPGGVAFRRRWYRSGITVARTWSAVVLPEMSPPNR